MKDCCGSNGTVIAVIVIALLVLGYFYYNGTFHSKVEVVPAPVEKPVPAPVKAY